MRILLLTAMIIFTSSASAGLYKWVDDEGNVHYSQKRPRDQEFKRIKPPAAVSESTESSNPSSNTKSNKAGAGSTAAAEFAKNKKFRETNCASAKQNLNAYQVYRRIRDKDGNVKIIDDKVRASKIAEAKQAINDFCD